MASTLHVRERGNGEPVLLVHSSGLSSNQWRRLGDALEPRFRVIAPDLIGYGKNARFVADPSKEYDFRADVEALEEIARATGRPVHLVGHSYGGLLVMHIAARGRVPVASISAYEPVAFSVLRSTNDPAWQQFSSTDEFFDLSEGLDGWVRRFVDWWNFEGAFDAMPEAGKRAFLDGREKVFAEVRSLMFDETPHSAYAGIEAPALLISGAFSPEPARRTCAILAATVKHGRHVEIEAGHMGPLTNADEVNALVVEHVERAAARG